MGAPIRSPKEIQTIINKSQNALANLGTEIIIEGNVGEDLTDVDFRAKVYRLILLRAYLKNILDPITGELKLFYTVSAQEQSLNILLDALQQLSGFANGAMIPLSIGRRGTVVYYPSTSGPSTGGQSQSGGPATPGGVTFQNLNVSSPSEVVDSLDASASDYAYYIISIRGTGVGEGSRLDIVGVQWRNAETPVITEYRGGDVGGSTTGVSFSAALNGGQLELTATVPTDGWVIRGTRISFENISFQNAQGPLPTGGTDGQYLRKAGSVDYAVAWAAIAIGEIAGLVTALTNLQTNINNEASTRASNDLLRLLLAGGTMIGTIAMSNNKITGLAAASSNGDAVRYEQLVAALAAAAAAQGDATSALANAATAQNTANTAQSTANSAQSDAASALSAVGTKADSAQPAWTNISLVNGWVSGPNTPQYFKDTLGCVHLRGSISGGGPAISNVFTTFPDAPSQDFQMVLDSGFLNINTSGIATHDIPIGNVYLDGISYWTH